MRFGELLVNNGLITEAQLEEALREQAHHKKKLGSQLLDLGYLTERQLVEVLEFQLGFPSVSLFETKIEPSVLSLITEAVARKYCVIPTKRSSGKLVVAMEDPLNYDALEEIRLSANMSVQPVIATRSEIEQAISRYYGMQDSVEELMEELEDDDAAVDERDAQSNNSPIGKLVNQIIYGAVVQRASDIHIEPLEKQVAIRYRVDGVLHQEKMLGKQMQNVLIARLKIIAKLNIAERRIPQDGRIQMQVDARKIDIRMSTLPTVHGESVVLRILDQSAGVKRISDLGMSESNLVKFEKVIQRPNGIALISGPTGSGKTSTLYTVLNRLHGPEVKIITVEDPVEYRLDGVNQVQVNTQVGLTFASGLRSILRQDPNIVMVGEIRDTETAEIAVRASLTGHLVLSTIHTNSSISTISRLIDMGIEPYLIASSLNCVVAQRLVRRTCRECAAHVPIREDERRQLEELGLIGQAGNVQSGTYGSPIAVVKDSTIMMTRGRGCSACNRTGFKGRLAIQEILVVDEDLRRAIAKNRPLDELRAIATGKGFTTMMYDGMSKALTGLTTSDEVWKAVADE
ncbi:GspE/PulE family protein [Paenibacillaceae bacterium WGS1546]|uniref:GspE/PulE family protein n=1 Tax=Cohnella sp. WGS1546 TaxID=3366810 RepID=UPI00372D291F